MELYADPLATTSRAVLAFCKAEKLDVALRSVALMKGEHRHASFTTLNPNAMVPVLVDGDLVLTEASAILTYLARKCGSKLYPEAPKERAKVDELIAWFGTNLYKDFGYQLIYPQVLPQHRRSSDEVNRGTIVWGREQAKRWFAVLDQHYLGPSRTWVAGDRLTIADYYGASIVSLGDLIGCTLTEYPNVRRWYRALDADDAWREVQVGFRTFAESIHIQGHSFTVLP